MSDLLEYSFLNKISDKMSVVGWTFTHRLPRLIYAREKLNARTLSTHTPALPTFPSHPSFVRTLTTIPTCPDATCTCREMPPDLDIDRKLPLANTMPAYHQHVLFTMGPSPDWASRIEDDERFKAVKEIKGMLGPKGEFSNPFHNVMMTASSHARSDHTHSFSAILLPQFQLVYPEDSAQDTFRTFTQAFLLPPRLDDRMPNKQSDYAATLVRKPELQSKFSVIDINDICVLICGHGARDQRCGILGPILEAEFAEKLDKSPYKLNEDLISLEALSQVGTNKETGSMVVQISHIGGHKFAGNIIIYIPPTLTDHPLAGKGIWYGRVEPKHVEGIVKKTVVEGVIIEDLFRGGIGKDGEVIRL